MDTFVSDGKAIDVTLAAATTKGTLVVAQGWVGIALADGGIGDTIAIEVEREHEIVVPGGVTAAKGDILYVPTTAGNAVVTNTATNNKAFGKVTVAKNAANAVTFKFLPQLTA
jgi:predicted RecA/RadA family phage recombinase